MKSLKQKLLLLAILALILLLVVLRGASSGDSVDYTTISPANIPQSESITINDLEINNPYNSATYISKQNASVYITKPDYEIRYSPELNSFRIHITSNPDSAIPQAEQALLALLDISPAEACQLTINVTVNPELNYQTSRRPSFCK